MEFDAGGAGKRGGEMDELIASLPYNWLHSGLINSCPLRLVYNEKRASGKRLLNSIELENSWQLYLQALNC